MIEDLFTPMHLLVLFVIVFFLFGAKRLPDLGKSMGRGIHEFRSGIAGLSDAEPEAIEQPAETSAVEATPGPTAAVEASASSLDAPVTDVAPDEAVDGDRAGVGPTASDDGDGAASDDGAGPAAVDEVVDPGDVTIVDEPVDFSPIEADEAAVVDDETVTSVADDAAAS